MFPDGPGFDLFGLVVLVFIGVFAFVVIQGIASWGHNMSQPVQQVAATVVTKRTDVHGKAEGRTHTTYFCTFQLADGSRKELEVPAHQYGMLVEGDRGRLSCQGSWFRNFTRQMA